MKAWKNLLLIAGTNRNVGKTTLACRIINTLAKTQDVIAVKITPHFHSQCDSCLTLYAEPALQITEEFSIHTLKDSSKMKAAGATRVFYVQGSDEKLPQVIAFLQNNIPDGVPIVCESAAMGDYLEPGKLIVLSGDLEPVKNRHLISKAHVHFKTFDFANLDFAFFAGEWHVKLKKV